MLKTELTTEPADDLKGAYVQKGDKWILDDLAADHPKMVENRTVIEEKKTAEAEFGTLNAKVGNLEKDLTDAKAKNIPHGYRAVSKEIAELGEAVKASGISKEELTTLKTDNEKFKAKEAETVSFALKQEAGKFLGYSNPDAFAKLAKELALTKEADGKFTVKVGDEQKPLTKEYVEQNDDFTPFLSSLSDKPRKIPFPEGGENTPGDPVEREVVAATQTGRYGL